VQAGVASAPGRVMVATAGVQKPSGVATTQTADFITLTHMARPRSPIARFCAMPAVREHGLVVGQNVGDRIHLVWPD